MEDGPGPRTREKSRSVSCRVAHDLLRNLSCPLVVGNVAKDEPTKRDQLDEPNAPLNGSMAKPDVWLQTVDLRPQIQHRNRPVSCRQLCDIVQSDHLCRGNHAATSAGRFGG